MMKAKQISIVAAIVVAVGVLAGLGGYTLGVKAGTAQAANARAAFLTERGVGGNPPVGAGPGVPDGVPGGQSGGAQLNVANLAMGQVKQVDGNTIQLSTATEVLKVRIGDQTQIQKMGQGSLSDIQPGERITVQGTRGSDGTFSAQMIQIGGAAGGGMPGQAPGAPSSN